MTRIELLGEARHHDLDGLAEVLVGCVSGGAGVGFLHPLEPSAARAWWARALGDGRVLTWVARDDDGRIVGCVRAVPAALPNAPHRAEVSKLLVHPRVRRSGTATALLAELERWARGAGRTLLVLDTESGSAAQRLYEGLGWTVVGEIADYALTPAGDLAPTTVLVKRLG